MLQLTHRTHIITLLVLASITFGLGQDLSQQQPPANLSTTNLTTEAGATTPTTTTTPISASALATSLETATATTTITATATPESATPESASASALSTSSTTTSGPTTPATTTTTTTTPRPKRPVKGDGKICKGVHIRNDLKSFEQLKDCRIIDGPLTIALVSNITNVRDYDNITFPLLTEITEYLLFFRVQNLTTLSRLFPNLSVIRGRELVSNYALIIYEMMQLQEIVLPSLTDILRGSVRIENNPNLCYVTTVQWADICKHTFSPHFIKDNSIQCNNRCPAHCSPWANITSTEIIGDKQLGAVNNRSLFCWNNQDCHETCSSINGLLKAEDGNCCDPMCAGGCDKSQNPGSCVSCRYVSQGGTCVQKCNSDLFEFKGECLTEDQCAAKKSASQGNQCDKGSEEINYKAIKIPGMEHGTCQELCPPGHEEDPEMKHKCKPCDKGRCRKICPARSRDKPIMVTDMDSLRELDGCNAINGSLELSLKGGKNVLHELETVFRNLEEIEGYLKITRSYPIITLSFFKSLKTIKGSSLDRGYALSIVDNPNLQELFIYNQSTITDQKPLNISNGHGKIFVHLNPKLCPHRIDSLKGYAHVQPWDERDVSAHTNGDKEACNIIKLGVDYVFGASNLAKIAVDNYLTKLEDPRVLLYYLINYREAPGNMTVTMFDGLDGCNSQNDVWTTVEESPMATERERLRQDVFIINLKPATRYALYVKTFTILSGSQGALSDIIYFETAPDTPGMPRELRGDSNSSETIEFSLLPPSRPNGDIYSYKVTVTRVPEVDDLQGIDVCDSIVGRNKAVTRADKGIESKSALTLPAKPMMEPTSASELYPVDSCSREKSSKNSEEKILQVTFQDQIIDIVYIKQPCRLKAPQKNLVKRSIEPELTTTESPSENSLPRKPMLPDQLVPASPDNTSVSQMLDGTILLNSTALLNNTVLDDPLAVMFNNSNPKTVKEVRASLFSLGEEIKLNIKGLDHFSLYTIEVVACHGNVSQLNRKYFLSSSYQKCSLEAVTQVRTKAKPENDMVDIETVNLTTSQETNSHTITWKSPPRPNGAVLAYRVKYRLNGTNHSWNERCIDMDTFERDHGIVLSDITAGLYVFHFQTTSMYIDSHNLWSEGKPFVIPNTNSLTWSFIIIFSLVLVALGVASGAYCFQKNARDDLIYASVNPDYVQYDPDEWEVDKAKLIVGPQIGTGSFGMVYKGQMLSEKGKRDCAVKTVPPTSTAKQRMDFLREASIMKQFDTFHVVKLLGVVSVTTPVYVIMEYMENGDLKDFLRNQRETHEKQNKTLVDGIYLMAAQIADGMAYLASRKFVHRDLAARNCMVGENRIIKIGDFGLTRDIYANDYYRRDTQGRLPVRWMAPESLSDNIYTSASDAWSYGIVLWEIVTFSAYPYQGLSNDEVIKRVIQGYTMPRPEHCPDKLHNIMDRCWRRNDKDRPAFLDIVEYLLPDTDGKLYPNCFYRKPKVEGDSIALSIPDDAHNGTESYPLLSWPSSNHNSDRMTNGNGGVGENHINRNHTPVNHIEKDKSN